MRLRSFAFGFILAVALARADATHIPAFASIIKKDGRAVISDGSSLFIFSHDGIFSQEPVSDSGRTVQGTWAVDPDGAVFTITGNWGWINGVSPISDSRKMVVVIYPATSAPKFETINREGTPVRIYDCYFEIEELVKISAGDGVSPVGH